MGQQAQLSAHHSKKQLSQSITVSRFLKAAKITALVSHPITHTPVLLLGRTSLWINLVDIVRQAFGCLPAGFPEVMN